MLFFSDFELPIIFYRLHRDVQHILGCIRKLPSDDSDGAQLSNQGLLDEFLTSKIGKIES